MKFLSKRSELSLQNFLWNESANKNPEIIGESFDGAEKEVRDLSAEYSDDVDSVLKNEKPKNFIRRSYNKMKNFFKTKVFGITEINYEQRQKNWEENAPRKWEKKEEEPLQNLSTGQIKETHLYQTDDVFMLWACIEKLIERSDFALRDPNLLKTINRVAGQAVFAEADYINLDNKELNEKFYDWVENTPELGEEKAELWTEKFIAENMAKADEDYKEDAHKAIENKEEFIGTISECFSDFSNQENLAGIDKGYVLAFLRLAIKKQKLNENLRKQLLIHGAAIGFLSSEDLIKIAEDFSGNNLWLNKLAESSFEDCKQWSAEINNGKIPNTAKEFTTENEEVLSSVFSEKDVLPKDSEVNGLVAEEKFKEDIEKAVDENKKTELKIEPTVKAEKEESPIAA